MCGGGNSLERVTVKKITKRQQGIQVTCGDLPRLRHQEAYDQKMRWVIHSHNVLTPESFPTRMCEFCSAKEQKV